MSEELKPLSKKHQEVLNKYLVCFNQTAAYMDIYPKATYESARTAAARLFADDNFLAHLQARLDEMHVSADEAIARLDDYSRAYLGLFFKVTDEWMFHPLPEYEILDEKKVVEEVDGEKVERIAYRVKHLVLDTERVMDPRYSHLIKKFTNSRRTGLSIEMYSAHEANRDILKLYGKFTDRVDVTSGGEKIKGYVGISPDDWKKKDDSK